jgi:hypothetical protein
MIAMRLAVITTYGIGLALLAGCREPNVQQSQSRTAVPGIAAQAGSGSSAMQGDKSSDGARPATLCNIETIGGRLFGAGPMALDGPTGVKGWLADQSGASPTQANLVIADPEKRVVREIPVQVSQERPDVVKAYPDMKGLEMSGFEADLNSAGLQPKTYHLYLAYMVESVNYSCDNGRYIVVH